MTAKDNSFSTKMTSISAKFLDAFKNLKSDAVPRPPRRRSKSPQIIIDDVTEENIENDENFEPEDVTADYEDFMHEDIPKSKKNVKNTGKGGKKKPQSNDYSWQTPAVGNVINIVDSEHIHVGPTYINTHNSKEQPQSSSGSKVELTSHIKNLMECKQKPNHEYMDYISKNLGKDWHRFFRLLDYTQGRIETFEIDSAKSSVSEARYKLLLDWVRNDEEGTLGVLAKKLWEVGEKQIVKKLASMYKQNLK